MNYNNEHPTFDVLVGKVLTSIIGEVGDESLTFLTDDGDEYTLYHSQDCCESVDIDDIIGNKDNMIGVPILMAEEVTFEGENPNGLTREYQESFTWTFYKLATEKGYLTIRWYGESNGYYSESVDFCKISSKIC